MIAQKIVVFERITMYFAEYQVYCAYNMFDIAFAIQICVIKYPGSKQNIDNLIQIHGNWLDRNIPQLYSLIICPLYLALYN